MDFPSKLLENAVNEMAQLPGIGKRTALRLVLHLLRQPIEQTTALTTALDLLRNEIKYCRSCYAISDTNLCEICEKPSRDHSIICVVEDVRDVMALENTGMFSLKEGKKLLKKLKTEQYINDSFLTFKGEAIAKNVEQEFKI